MKLFLYTYPRSGMHLLRDHIQQKLDVEVSASHDALKPENSTFVTIIRDPKYSIASWVSMEMYYDDMEATPINRGFAMNTEEAKKRYLLFANHALKYVTLFFDYEDLTRDPDLVINYLSDNLGISRKSYDYTNMINDEVYRKHIVSSKKSKYYDEALKFVESYDLDLCYKQYDILKSKCINLV